jgi:hypothetical protein
MVSDRVASDNQPHPPGAERQLGASASFPKGARFWSRCSAIVSRSLMGPVRGGGESPAAQAGDLVWKGDHAGG